MTDLQIYNFAASDLFVHNSNSNDDTHAKIYILFNKLWFYDVIGELSPVVDPRLGENI